MFKGGSQASGCFKYPRMIPKHSQVWEPLVYNEPGYEVAAGDTKMTRTDTGPTFLGLNPSKGFKQVSICGRGCQLSSDLISPPSRAHTGLNFPASFAVRWSHGSEFWLTECEQKPLVSLLALAHETPQVCASVFCHSCCHMWRMAEPRSAQVSGSTDN